MIGRNYLGGVASPHVGEALRLIAYEERRCRVLDHDGGEIIEIRICHRMTDANISIHTAANKRIDSKLVKEQP